MEDSQQKLSDDEKRVLADVAAAVRKELRKGIPDQYLGDQKQVVRALEEFTIYSKFGARIISSNTAWSAMTLKDKAKWFIFNIWPFRSVGVLLRQKFHEIQMLHWRIDGITGIEHCHEDQVPCWLHQHPKSIIKTEIAMPLSRGISSLEIKIDV